MKLKTCVNLKNGFVQVFFYVLFLPCSVIIIREKTDIVILRYILLAL